MHATTTNAEVPMRTAWTAPAVLVVVAAAVAVSFTTGLGTLIARTGLVAAGIGLMVVGLVVRRPTPLRPYVLVLAGLASSLLGDVLVLADAVSADLSVGAADATLTAVAGALVLVGMVDATTVSRGGDAGGTLDAVLVAIAGGTLLWHVVVIESATPGWLTTGAEAAGFVQVLSLVAVLALLVRTRQSLPGRQRTSATLLVFAVLASLAAFLVGASRDAAGVVEQYLGVRAGLGVAANLLVGVAVLHPSTIAITARRQPPEDRLTRWRILMLAIALWTPPAIYVVEHLQGHANAILGVATAWMLLVPTVLARLHLLMRGRERALVGVVDADRRLASMLAHTGDLLLLVRRSPSTHDPGTPEVVVEYASPAADALLGIEPDDLEGRSPLSVVASDDRDAMERLFVDAGAWPAVIDVRVVRSDGSLHWCEVEIDHYLDDTDVAIVSLRDVDARKTVELNLSEAARRDELTGALNRRGLTDMVALVVPRREAGTVVGCITADLDGFKAINDHRGHAAGDEVLRIVARRLLKAVRDGDLVGRPGGDEFTVVCPAVTSLDDLRRIAERILVNVERPMRLRDGPATVGVSLGVAVLRDGESPAALFARSDAALLEAKATGKGRIVIADVAAVPPVRRPLPAAAIRDQEAAELARSARAARRGVQSRAARVDAPSGRPVAGDRTSVGSSSTGDRPDTP